MIKDLYDYLAKPDKTIGEHVEDLIFRANILRKLGYIKDIHIYNLLIQACKGHDLGKANKEFLKRILNPKLHFDETKEISHNILSVYYLDKNEFDENTDDYLIVACCILFHHDYCNEPLVIKTRTSQINSLLIPEYNQKPSRRMLKNICNNYLKKRETIIVKGLLHRCDYSASGNYEIEYPNDFLEAGLAQMMNEWQKKKKDSCWNELQEFCIENREENIIALAPTGMGKTEAGLLWIGNHKGFFILPIRTAINAIYDRIKNQILKDEKLKERLGLLHSESLSYYGSHVGQEMDILDYRNRGQALSLPLNISTLDQLFDFVFKYKGYEMKLATLAYSKIVIDEIQMYSPDLLAYLIYGMEHIAKMGGKIAIMTATLSPFVKELLEKYVGFSKDNQKVFINDSIRHNVKVMDRKINAKDILDLYEENERKGISNKILVVCNKIATAQKLMEAVKAEAAGKNISATVNIFHSRFIKKDRAKLEEEIIKFGKTYDKNGNLDKQSGIWIATSIVEASLDIDFDYLFTELLDLNSLFQRFGRCNRKGAKNVTMYNCYVYTQLDEGDFILGNKGFIDKTIFELSNKAIHDINGKLSESKKQELINRYLTTENISQSHFIKKFREKYRFIDSISIYSFKKNENKLRNILSETIIPETVYEKYKEEIDTISQKLNSERLTAIERKCLRSNILQYSLEIPYYHWNSYEKAMKKGCVHQYQSINLSLCEKIKVMQCRYDEMGYYKIEFVDDVD